MAVYVVTLEIVAYNNISSVPDKCGISVYSGIWCEILGLPRMLDYLTENAYGT